jgi:hypothetical protein
MVYTAAFIPLPTQAQNLDLTYQPALMICVYSVLPTLDDGISSADVIAQGVTRFCLNALCRKMDCPPDAATALPPFLLPEVLQYRHDHVK